MARKTNILVLQLLLAVVLLSPGSSVIPGAAATRSVADFAGSPASRALLQTLDTCKDAIPNCVGCGFHRGGGVTYAVCTACAEGYRPRSRGRECWCTAGYYWTADSQCLPCGYGGYCAGAKSTALSAQRIPCGDNKNTTSEYAKTDRECLTDAGYGWGMDGAYRCPKGFWSAGLSARRCAICNSGMTTAREGAVSPTECEAEPGHYFLHGRAPPCARGTYKEEIGNVDCSICPDGFTTPPHTSAAITRATCNYVTAGYAAAANAELGATNATLCPEDTYRSTELPYDPANGVTCIACPPGMVTGPGNEGATSLEACLAPPGYGYDPFAGNATICPLGWFKEGYNRQSCTLCGLGTITTDAPGATMADECLIPAGHFTTRSADGETLTGAPCPVGTYGRLNSTYGLVDVECVKCDEHTITLGIGSNAVLQCVTEPGYGWYNGQVEECAYGYYSPGNNQNPCVWCGSGFNTTAGGATTVAAITGATASTDCVVAAGWTGDGVSGIKPCTRGWYKSLLGDSPCLRCPRGTTTSISDGAVALSDCDSCLAGFYNAALNVSDPGCTICTSGTYSFGNRPGGNGCLDCPKPLHYTGKMASRRGIPTPEYCVAEFSGDGFENYLEWDFIPMDATALTVTNHTSIEECQAACSASADCQYLAFDLARPAGARCLLRDTVPWAAVDVTDAGKDYVMFEVDRGNFVAYPAHATDAASLGTPLASYASKSEATAACNGVAACVGFKFVHTEASTPWKTFGGTKWPNVIGKVRAVGESINTWIPEPTG